MMIFMVIQWVSADEIEFTASARNQVSLGDRFQLTYTVNAKGGDFSGPEIADFRTLSGPNMSTSESYQVINGRMSQSVTVNYIYYLQAFKEGTFEIPPASVSIGGTTYQSNALRIEVLKGNLPERSVPKTPPGQGQAGQTEAGTSGDDAGEDVFLRALISKKDPYIGEEVIVTYKIYTANIPISNINIENLASFPGFWSTSLTDDKKQITTETEMINGREYSSGVLYRTALFPQKAGEITIQPKKLTCTAQVRVQGTQKSRNPFFDSFFDDPFFSSQYRNVRLEMESEAITLKVKPLPVDTKPAGFSGAVGRFSIQGSVDQRVLSVNDAITLKLVISGNGNLELINTPEINWPPDFETYEPKISKNIRTTPAGISGSRTYEYLAIPRSAGEFTIDPVEFSYFDPGTNRYHVLSTKAFTFTVEKGEQDIAGYTYGTMNQEGIRYLGQDIRYIKTGAHTLSLKNHYLFGSGLFFLLLALPPALLLFFAFMILRARKRRLNKALVRNRKATRVARKNLKKSREFLKEQKPEAFYAEISRALWGYLSDKFNIPLSDLSMESVNIRLTAKGVNPEIIERFTGVLDKCEFARFAPGDSTSLMNDIYNDSISIISQIEGALRS